MYKLPIIKGVKHGVTPLRANLKERLEFNKKRLTKPKIYLEPLKLSKGNHLETE